MINRISQQLKELDELSFENILMFPIPGSKRRVVLLWDGQMEERDVYRIMNERLEQWESFDQPQDLKEAGLEHWLLAGLKKAGLQYITLYIE